MTSCQNEETRGAIKKFLERDFGARTPRCCTGYHTLSEDMRHDSDAEVPIRDWQHVIRGTLCEGNIQRSWHSSTDFWRPL